MAAMTSCSVFDECLLVDNDCLKLDQLTRVLFLALLFSCCRFVFVVEDGLLPTDLFVLSTLLENGRGCWKVDCWSGVDVHRIVVEVVDKWIQIANVGLNTEDSEEILGSHHVEVQETHYSLYLMFDCSRIE